METTNIGRIENMTRHLGYVLCHLLSCPSPITGGAGCSVSDGRGQRWGANVGHDDQHTVNIGHISDGMERVVHKVNLQRERGVSLGVARKGKG